MSVAPGEGGFRLYRDLSYLANERLVEEIIAQAQSQDIISLTAGETLPETAEIDEYHARIQRIQEVEEFGAHILSGHILDGASQAYSRPGTPPVLFRSLDDLISKKGTAAVRTDSLNDFRLTKPQQVLFLRGVIIATTAREWEVEKSGKGLSQRQLKLQRQALFSLRHLATNPVHVPESIEGQEINRFMGQYTANYLARSVLRELHAQGRISHASTSVDAAINLPIAFGQLASGDQMDVVTVFPPGTRETTESENLGFKPVYPADVDEERIKRLRNMQLTFGGPFTEFRYFESIKPFQPAQKEHGPDGSPGGGDGQSNGEDDKDEEDYNYLVLEIVHPDHEDRRRTHVVADHPEKGNACYALREEVLDEWERILGIRLSWRDVFTQSRQTAKQIGARAFHHNKGSNVDERVRKYLRQEAESLVLETFASIFDRKENELFDDDMQPTVRNRMPNILIAQIRRSVVLREMWPSIREYGYANYLRQEAAGRRANQQLAAERERKYSLVERASQIFAAILDEGEFS